MFEIRRGMPEDAEKIIKYLKIIGTETDNLTFDGGISFTVEQEREYLNMVYNSSRSLYLIAVENDEVIGCASLDTSLRERLKHRGSLGVSVQKKAWGKHIGSRLMEELLKFAKDTATKLYYIANITNTKIVILDDIFMCKLLAYKNI